MVILPTGEQIDICGGEAHTTNNRMELMGAICALEYCIVRAAYLSKETSPSAPSNEIVLWTDSQYVKNGITQWLPTWVRKNWRSSNGEPVKNQDLWQQLHTLAASLPVRWEWVKGHAGTEGNERADVLATTAAKSIADKLDRATRRTQHNQAKKLQPKRVYLVVPFADKDAAKELGGRWDPAKKRWYCFEENSHLFERWSR